MCGIAGFIGKKKDLPSKKKLENCRKLMKVRGPDGFKHKLINHGNNASIILHSRLAIIDPKERSDQPMEDETGVLAFNGMIYNYLEIKKTLKKKNIHFQTKSDTEVLLKLLNTFGISGLKQLEGMWSFFYFNKKTNQMILSRDLFGEKPLYYSIVGKSIYFGSNINYIKQLSNKKYLLDYGKINLSLNFGYKTFFRNENTFFKNINSLKPGNSLIVDNFDRARIINNSIKNLKIENFNYQNSKKKIKKALNENFSRVIRSDFPVACLLSGGIDSNLVASFAKKFVAKKFKCFSIKNRDENYDESSNIDMTVKKLKIKHSYITYNKRNSIKHLEILVKQTSCIVPTITWLLYSSLIKKIKENGYKVVLGGAGGDEFFAGYYIHHLLHLKNLKKNKLGFSQYYNDWYKNVRPLVRSKYLNDFYFFLKNSKKINSNLTPFLENRNLLKKKIKKKIEEKIVFKDELKNFLYHEIFYSSLPAQLVPADNISMFHGVEHRSPILNKDLFRLSFSIKNDHLIKNGYGKFVLRDILSNYLNKKIAWSRNKVGFFTDIKNIFDIKDKNFKKLLFQSKKINSLVNIKEVEKILNQNKKLTNSQSHLIFSILNFVLLEKYYGK